MNEASTQNFVPVSPAPEYAARFAAGAFFKRLTAITLRHFNRAEGDVFSKSRKDLDIIPRRILSYLSYHLSSFNLHDVGRKFRTDHSTVHNAITHLRDVYPKKPEFGESILSILVEAATGNPGYDKNSVTLEAMRNLLLHIDAIKPRLKKEPLLAANPLLAVKEVLEKMGLSVTLSDKPLSVDGESLPKPSDILIEKIIAATAKAYGFKGGISSGPDGSYARIIMATHAAVEHARIPCDVVAASRLGAGRSKEEIQRNVTFASFEIKTDLAIASKMKEIKKNFDESVGNKAASAAPDEPDVPKPPVTKPAANEVALPIKIERVDLDARIDSFPYAKEHLDVLIKNLRRDSVETVGELVKAPALKELSITSRSVVALLNGEDRSTLATNKGWTLTLAAKAVAKAASFTDPTGAYSHLWPPKPAPAPKPAAAAAPAVEPTTPSGPVTPAKAASAPNFV